MATVLVTDGEQRSALAVVRSLGRAGHVVLVASSQARPLAGASRWSAGCLKVPDPLHDPGAFAAAIGAAVSARSVAVVVPVTEAAHLALFPARHLIRPAILAAGKSETFTRAADKALVIDLAASLGIGVPRQVAIDAGLPAASLDAASLQFPVVVKPSRSVGEADGHRQKLGVLHAENATRLREIVAALPPAAFPVLVQERIVGPGLGIFVLRWQGRTIARFAHQRLREKPPSGGVSVLSESIPGDPELVAAAEALLGVLDWEGVAMVEFKRDAGTGRPYLMEINGRFWGSLQLAIDAGVDFPRLLVEATLGGTPQETLAWRSGLRSRWFWGDLDHLLVRLVRSPSALNLPPGSPSRGGAFLSFLGWRPWRERDAVFRLSDPMPFLRESIQWVRAL